MNIANGKWVRDILQFLAKNVFISVCIYIYTFVVMFSFICFIILFEFCHEYYLRMLKNNKTYRSRYGGGSWSTINNSNNRTTTTIIVDVVHKW